MEKQHVQTFIALAERARNAGLIQFNEMPAVLQAINAANTELQQPEAAQNKADGEEIQAKAAKRGN